MDLTYSLSGNRTLVFKEASPGGFGSGTVLEVTVFGADGGVLSGPARVGSLPGDTTNPPYEDIGGVVPVAGGYNVWFSERTNGVYDFDVGRYTVEPTERVVIRTLDASGAPQGAVRGVLPDYSISANSASAPAADGGLALWDGNTVLVIAADGTSVHNIGLNFSPYRSTYGTDIVERDGGGWFAVGNHYNNPDDPGSTLGWFIDPDGTVTGPVAIHDQTHEAHVIGGYGLQSVDIAVLTDGRFAVAVADVGEAAPESGGLGTWVTVLEADGTVSIPTVLVNTDDTQGEQIYPEIFALDDGGFAVAYRSRNGLPAFDRTEVRSFDADGAPVDTLRLDDAPGDSSQYVSVLGDGTVLLLTDDGGVVGTLAPSGPAPDPVLGDLLGDPFAFHPDIDADTASFADYATHTHLMQLDGDTVLLGYNGLFPGVIEMFDPVTGAEERLNILVSHEGTYAGLTGPQDTDFVTTAPLPGGGFVGAWVEEYQRPSGSVYVVEKITYLQRFGADGSPLGAAVELREESSRFPNEANLTAVPDGVWLVTESAYETYRLQKYDATLTPVGTPVDYPVSARTPELVALDQGRIAVLREADGTSENGFIETAFLEIRGADGSLVGTPVDLTAEVAGAAESHILAAGAMADGGAVVLFSATPVPGDATQLRLYAEVFGPDGARHSTTASPREIDLGLPPGAVGLTTGLGPDFEVIGTPQGGYAIAFRATDDRLPTTGNLPDANIYLTVFDANEALVLAPKVVNADYMEDDQGGIDLVVTEGGELLVSYYDEGELGGVGPVRVQRVFLGEADPVVVDPGPDPITGTDASEPIMGTGGDDTILGLGGDDWITPGAGADSIDGGAGRDMLSYVDATSPVVVNLGLGIGSGGAAGDVFTGIERVTGSSFADLFYGSEGNDEFRGLGGSDWFVGSAGRDIYDGGDGTDTVSYAEAATGVRASLLLGRGSTGQATSDSYTAIENLTGSGFADVLTGDHGANTLRGLSGDDTIWANNGDDHVTGGRGDDYLDGSAGFDTAHFSGNRDDYTVLTGSAGVVVAHNMAGGDGSDSLFNFEALAFADGIVFL